MTEAQRDALPLSPAEAKRVASALIAHPIAFLAWVGGLSALIAGNRSPIVIGAMGIAFITVAIVTVILFGATIRIVGRSGKSFGAMMLDFQARVPWRLAFGDLGRRVFELAGWSRRMLWVQRGLFGLAFASLVVWAVFIVRHEA